MNNKEFITDLASRTKLSSKEAASLASATVSAIIGELLEENSIFVPGFGTFEVKKKLIDVISTAVGVSSNRICIVGTK